VRDKPNPNSKLGPNLPKFNQLISCPSSAYIFPNFFYEIALMTF